MLYHHFFIRHLATDKNDPQYDSSPALQHKVRSQENVKIPLNDEGYRQGQLLEQYFGRYLASHNLAGPFLLVHSGYERTKRTLGYIQESMRQQQIPISGFTIDTRIRDIDHGKANDLPFEETLKRFPEYAQEIEEQGYLDAQPPDGETYRDAVTRVRSYVEELKRKNTSTVTVTHLSTLVVLRWVLEGLSDEQVVELLAKHHPPNGSATYYTYNPDTVVWEVQEIYQEPWSI